MTASGPDRKPSVCLLIGTFHPVVGGGETHARMLGRALIERGVAVQVVTRLTDARLPRLDTVDGITVHRVGNPGSPRWGKYRMLIPALLALYRLRRTYDVLYVCGLRVLGVTGLAAAHWTGKRCILRAEAMGEMSGAFIWDSPHAKLGGMRRCLAQWLVRLRNRWYRRADCFLAVSGAVEQEFVSAGVTPDRLVRINNGIDVRRFSPEESPDARRALRRTLGLPEHDCLLAYSGKLNRGKGLEMLVETWSNLVPRYPGSRLVLIGGGGDHFLSCENELRETVRRKGLDDRIIFTGYVDNVPDYLRAMDGYVFPSEQESFALAPLEAMATGLPVIVTRTGELGLIVQPGVHGWLMEPQNPAALQAAMEAFLADPSGARVMGTSGRARVVEHCGLDAVAARHEALFRRLMETGRPV